MHLHYPLARLALIQVELNFSPFRLARSAISPLRAFGEPIDFLKAKVVPCQVHPLLISLQRLWGINSFSPSIGACLGSISADFLAQKPRKPEQTALHSLGTQANKSQTRDRIRRQSNTVVQPEQLTVSFQVRTRCDPAERVIYLPQQDPSLAVPSGRRCTQGIRSRLDLLIDGDFDGAGTALGGTRGLKMVMHEVGRYDLQIAIERVWVA